MRPLVGITAWRREMDTYLGMEDLHTLSDHYVAAVSRAGLSPVVLPSARSDEHAEQLAEVIDGLVLSGGGDVDPSSYGAEPTSTIGNDPDADSYELALIDEIRRRRKPLLAICRGLQILNVALGGTLNQEVTSAGGVHEVMEKDTDPEDLNSRSHKVSFSEGSILAELYGATEAEVNTLHHQGILELADELVVEAVADDGLVEAARVKGDWWALGVQWHPERMSEKHRVVFDAFEEAIRAR